MDTPVQNNDELSVQPAQDMEVDIQEEGVSLDLTSMLLQKIEALHEENIPAAVQGSLVEAGPAVEHNIEGMDGVQKLEAIQEPTAEVTDVSMAEPSTMDGVSLTDVVQAPTSNTNTVAAVKTEAADEKQSPQVVDSTLTDTIAVPGLKEEPVEILEPVAGTNILPAAMQEPTAEEQAEWEVDSNPLSSDSDSSSDDSSSEEDSDDGDDAYKLLTPAEQAALLMQEDGNSDDEHGKSSGGPLRTKNEKPEEVIPKPSITITPEMTITKLGVVISIVENTVVVNSDVGGETRRLDAGSVLCLADRSVIGVISETFGPVPTPFYSVRFTNMAEITEAGLTGGTEVYYSEQHSQYVFPKDLRGKGTDASNLHDEEAGDGEIDFSDDEEEKAYKDRLKAKRRGGKVQNNGRGATRGGGHGRGQRDVPRQSGDRPIDYDDAEDDGPYRPLSRPSVSGGPTNWGQAPQGSSYDSPPNQFGAGQNGRVGDFRGSFRGRGDGGRGGDRDRRGGRGGNGYSQAPQNRQNSGGSLQSPQSHGNQQFPNSSSNNNQVPPVDYTQQQYQQWQQVMTQFPQFPLMGQNGYPAMPNFPGIPPVFPGMNASTLPIPPPNPQAGAYVNPAFFNGNRPGSSTGYGNQQNQQQNQNQYQNRNQNYQQGQNR